MEMLESGVMEERRPSLAIGSNAKRPAIGGSLMERWPDVPFCIPTYIRTFRPRHSTVEGEPSLANPARRQSASPQQVLASSE